MRVKSIVFATCGVLFVSAHASASIQDISTTTTWYRDGVPQDTTTASGNVFTSHFVDYNIGATSGLIRVRGEASHPAPTLPVVQATATAEMTFTAIDGTFTPTVSAAFSQVLFNLIDLDNPSSFHSWQTGASQGSPNLPIVESGPMTFPAGPGHYKLAFESLSTPPNNALAIGAGLMQLSITPEPSLLAYTLVGLAARRSRR